jgi:transcriptional regulator with XRE-family HTH domain
MAMPGNRAGWFGAQLTALREKAGMTQEQLAQKVGMTLGAITLLERGERSPAWSTMTTLANALGVGVEVFAEEMMEDTRPRRGRGRRERPTTLGQDAAGE